MSCGTQVGAKEWFLRSNKGIIALRQAEYQMPWPTDHKPMRTRWVTFHEQKWVRSRERRGVCVSGLAVAGVGAANEHARKVPCRSLEGNRQIYFMALPLLPRQNSSNFRQFFTPNQAKIGKISRILAKMG